MMICLRSLINFRLNINKYVVKPMQLSATRIDDLGIVAAEGIHLR